jgi:hypothetical protein
LGLGFAVFGGHDVGETSEGVFEAVEGGFRESYFRRLLHVIFLGWIVAWGWVDGGLVWGGNFG